MTRTLKARLLFTLAAVVIYEAGAHIPLPLAVFPVSIFRLGIVPYSVDWVPVFEADTDLEVDLARGVLERAGIPTVRSSNRVIPVTGSLAFWETSRPSYPSLTINRRLGDGHVYAAVPADQELRAQSLLALSRDHQV